MTAPILQIKDLEFAYPGRAPVLRIPHFEIQKGERFFLFGESGSGKTTLLGLIAGVLEVHSGSIRVLDQELKSMSTSQRDFFRGAHFGYIFQLFNLVPYLTVLENMTLGCEMNSIRRARLKSSPALAAKDLAIQLGLEKQIHSSVLELSVGQQQRVAVGRALLGSPELIIADEPTSALDADHRLKFIQLLFEQCKQSGASLVFVSHDRSLQGSFDRSASLSELNRGIR